MKITKLRPSGEKLSAPSPSRRALYEVEPEVAPRVREEPATMSGHGNARVVSATEAARNFSDLISRVCYKGETYVVERGGKVMCQLVPVETRRCSGADLLALLTTLARPAGEFLSAVEEVSRHQPLVEPSTWEK
jgi:antitoxin (DNA-binding transcriptional repressor) of toxin-antitoxin stability system